MVVTTLSFIDHPDHTRTVFTAIGRERVIVASPRNRSPIANVLLIHGLSDYPARHVQNARRLAGRGYRTVMVELAGHGGQADEWARTMPLYEAYAAGRSADVLRWLGSSASFSSDERRTLIARQYRRLESTRADDHLTQVATVLRHLPRLTGDPRRLPLFLVGHSMGALLAHETMWRLGAGARADVAGVVLLAPALRPQGNPDSPLMQLAVNALWELRRAPVSPTRMALKTFLDLNFRVDSTWGNKWLSDLPEEVELSASDPLMPHFLPTRYASSIESLMVQSARRGARVPYEALVVVPRRDGITSREAAITFARRANSAGDARLNLVCLDAVAHDILRSSSRERALTAIVDWLDRRVCARSPETLGRELAS
jgi:alpha-beta hydrolase superfamily lysophospholipase